MTIYTKYISYYILLNVLYEVTVSSNATGFPVAVNN